MRMTRTRRWIAVAIAATAALVAPPAAANLVLNQAVVDLAPTAPPRADVEAWNNGTERMYVVAEPASIVDPGTPGERRVAGADPAESGLLVTPQKMILEPGERKLIRIAAVAPRGARDRVYRVTVKPVAGEVSAAASALKVLVGYDMLVIVRPATMTGEVSARRDGGTLVLTNAGTTSVEMYDGQQCGAGGGDCRTLPSRRLYAGASWSQPVDPARPVAYKVKTGLMVKTMTFR